MQSWFGGHRPPGGHGARAGPEHGIYGAKITGGGSGGTVAVLARPEAREQVFVLACRYAEENGRGGSVFEGSSDGAEIFGVRRYASLSGT